MGRQTQQPNCAKRRSLSIRVRLMILAVIAIVPIVLERVHNEEFNRGERIEAASQQALGLAHRAAALQSDVFVSARSLLTALAATRAIGTTVDESCAEILKTVAQPERGIRNVSIADLRGRIFCSSNPLALGLDISARSHFTNALAGGQFSLSDYFMGTRDQTPLVIASMPQRDRFGNIEAVLLATLDLNWLGQIAGALTTRPGSMMMLVDAQGTVLSYEPNPANWIGRNLAEQLVIMSMLKQEDGVITAASPDGVRRVFAFANLPGTTARVAIGFDETEVLRSASSAMWIAFAELAAVALLVLLAIWFGAERLLVRPIRVLIEAAGRIGRGEDKTRADELPWAAEFIPLAAALDEMTEKLDAREQELRDINMQLRELAQLDSLTGLANRRTFNAQLLTEWKAALKRQTPISALMIDVDHFKAFNDQYGHVQGDACLRKVGEALKRCTRTRSDFIAAVGGSERDVLPLPAALARDMQMAARYGGEEFAVLLPGVNLETATRIAERTRQAVEDLLIAHAGAPWGFVSISLGVASIVPSERASPQELTEAADSSLYEAKQCGRNRVIARSEIAPLRASA